MLFVHYKQLFKGGVSEGGGMTFVKVSSYLNPNQDREKDFILGYTIIKNILFKPFEQLCINSDKDYSLFYTCTEFNDKGYNFKTQQWEHLKETGVIDPLF